MLQPSAKKNSSNPHPDPLSQPFICLNADLLYSTAKSINLSHTSISSISQYGAWGDSWNGSRLEHLDLRWTPLTGGFPGYDWSRNLNALQCLLVNSPGLCGQVPAGMPCFDKSGTQLGTHCDGSYVYQQPECRMPPTSCASRPAADLPASSWSGGSADYVAIQSVLRWDWWGGNINLAGAWDPRLRPFPCDAESVPTPLPGITCDGGRVVELNATAMGLSRNFSGWWPSPAIAGLTALRKLDLSNLGMWGE